MALSSPCLERILDSCSRTPNGKQDWMEINTFRPHKANSHRILLPEQ
ncbi:unnamed protein product [Larinioides sclopetarius]|uniref:Uncharacterized protein n=1 Tax=Larinioides sclopetarius TaxID=280406 RepID=A0AAV1YSP3_9ARAC